MSQGILVLIEFPPTSRDQAHEYATEAAKLIHEEYARKGFRVRYEPVRGKVLPTDKTTTDALVRDAVVKLGGTTGGTASSYLPPTRDVNPFDDEPPREPVPTADLRWGARVLTLGGERIILTSREASILVAIRTLSGRGRQWVSADAIYGNAQQTRVTQATETTRRGAIAGLTRRIREKYPNLHLIESRAGRVGGYRWSADSFDLHEEPTI